MAVNSVYLRVDLMIILVIFLCMTTVYSQGQTSTNPSTATTIATTTTVPPSTVPENTDIGVCTCDLTGNSCDVNCCCDPDCSFDDRQAFSGCDDEYTASDNQACVKSSIIFRENTPYTVNETSDGLFCIETDNYEERNYYEVPETITSNSDFEQYIAEYGRTSFKRDSTSSALPTTSYRSGDPILTVYETNAIGRLGLPRALTSQQCVDNNPAAFLYEQRYTCVREISDLSTQCNQTSLDANTYFAFFKIISTPEILSEYFGDSSTETTTVATQETQQQNPQNQETTESGGTTSDVNTVSDLLYYSDYAINVTVEEPLICMDSNGLNSTCTFNTSNIPSPTYSVDTCFNVVSRVEYVITHNSTGGVVSAAVRLAFADITETNIPVNQAFVSNFQKEEEYNTTSRSGNPGYVVGLPLLAGTRTTVTDVNGDEKQVILMDSNRYNRLTIVTSSATGECITDPSRRVPVTFGENMRSGCKISVTLNNMTDNCQLISDVAVVALEGSDLPTHVATFGDVTVEEVGDWLSIFTSERSQTGSAGSGFCTKVVVGMHIEVLYANVGSLGNPQAKIIGVKRTFQQSDISFQCTGPYCQPGTEDRPQKFEVTSSVEFIDASEPTVAVDAEYPEFTARLPEDFFYPFT